MKHLIEYMYYPVRIVTIDGRILEGVVVSYENATEHDLDSDAISLDYVRWRESISEDEIKSIAITGQRDLPPGMEDFFQ